MRSPRTDEQRTGRLVKRAFLDRLNVRLVVALATVALVGLLVSGVAISQALPSYFLDQTRSRLESAIVSTYLQLRDRANLEIELRPQNLEIRELRDTRFLQGFAESAANQLIQGTVEFYYADGSRAAIARPGDTDALVAAGLRPDPQVGRLRAPFELPVSRQAGSVTVVPMELVVSEPYTGREASLAQVQSSLIGAGLLALVVSLITGIIAARRLTVPIWSLRRVAGQFGQGQLDERASLSGVAEIDELAVQFNVMADRLSETLRMLEADRDRLREFVADVSHELRTPIAALRAFTELQRDGEVDERTRHEFLDRSTEQISRLEWLSTNLLDLSRIDAGIFPLDMRIGDLRDPVRSVVEAHSQIAEERGIALTSEVPAHPVELRFDHERVVQLVTNLVGNALKFTPRNGSVHVRLTDAADGVAIEVRDTGPGIPADELPHIFDRFYRGTNTGEARASGSGLGLAIARSIVEMHGGEIDVTSQVGGGTAFRVALPRALARRTEDE